MARQKKASLFQKNGSWYVCYWSGSKRRRVSTGTKNKKLAERVRLEKERQMILGVVETQEKISQAFYNPAQRESLLGVLQEEEPITVESARADYETHSRTFKAPKTISSDNGRLDKFFSFVNVTFITEVSTKSVSAFMAHMASENGSKPATLLRYREVLHAFYEWARSEKHVKENPISGVPRPRIPERDIRYMPLEKIAECLEVFKGDEIEGVVATAIYAGLRRQEICWLTWEDVSLEDGRPLLRIRSKTIDGRSWSPKTRRNRNVPISDDLVPFLKAQKLRTGTARWVFPSPEGCRWDPDNLSRQLRAAAGDDGSHWNFTIFRHTFGSLLAQANVSLQKIALLMGNSPAIAARHYVRLVPEQMHDEVNFPRKLGG